MFTHPAPNPRPSDPDGAGRVAPAGDGVVPTPGQVDTIDWSGDAQVATVGRLLDAARRLDAVAGEVVCELIRAIDTGATEHALGAAVEVVLAQSCRLPGFERTTLLKAAHVLGRMPATLQEFRTGRMSWAQVRAIVKAAGRLRVADLSWLDDVVAGLVESMADCEGDWLVWEVDQHVDALLADRQPADRRRVYDGLRATIQPGLDGSGRIGLDCGPDHFPAAADSAYALAAAKYGRLHDGADRHVDLDDHVDDDGRVDDRALTDAAMQAAKLAQVNARRLGGALFQLITGLDPDSLEPAAVGGPGGRPGLSLLVTCTIQDLLGPTRDGNVEAAAGTGVAWWLGPFGGRIKVTSEVARRWADIHGADSRLIVLDDVGEVVGVGRRSRHAPDWLRDAIVARDLHCTAPASTTPAVFCDVDHVQGWEQGGPTDAPNLGLVSRRWHTRKTNGQWRLERHPDGTRTWTNTRTGYQVRQPARTQHRPPPRGP